jgi:chaperone modulatory protein CbpM
MITLDILCSQISNLHPQDVERWIGNQWVRVDRDAGQYRFHDIDVARVRLIVELRDTMQVNEDALPVVLGLLDQLYELRRQMRRLGAALEEAMTDEVRHELTRRLNGGF